VIQLLEATVGRIETGQIAMIDVRLENPNPFELVLKRDTFKLTGHGKEWYSPETAGTQAPLIKLPANGVLDKEAFSYAVPDDALAGTLALQIGKQYFVMIKNDRPFGRRLRNGQFVTFRGRHW
jgi:hypothetical protein